MPLKMTRRRFARLSAAAGASVWVRPVFGETHEAAEWAGRSCPRSLGLVQRARIISKAFAASRSSGLSASALRSSSAPRSI